MPDARLQRTREAYSPADFVRAIPSPPVNAPRFAFAGSCGHRFKIVRESRVFTQPDGTTVRELLPPPLRVSHNQRFCVECGQLVDPIDDEEARRAKEQI